MLLLPTSLCTFSLVLTLSYANYLHNFTDPHNLKDCFPHLNLKNDSCVKISIYLHQLRALELKNFFGWKGKLEIQNSYPVLVRYNKIGLDPKLLKLISFHLKF